MSAGEVLVTPRYTSETCGAGTTDATNSPGVGVACLKIDTLPTTYSENRDKDKKPDCSGNGE